MLQRPRTVGLLSSTCGRALAAPGLVLPPVHSISPGDFMSRRLVCVPQGTMKASSLAHPDVKPDEYPRSFFRDGELVRGTSSGIGDGEPCTGVHGCAPLSAVEYDLPSFGSGKCGGEGVAEALKLG